MAKSLNILFFGTPEPAKHILSSLVESEHKVTGVITRTDKKRGRGSSLVATPVKELADESKIEVHEPNTNDELEQIVKQSKADVGIVVAYGRILKPAVLDHFKHGCINIHYSLLPKLRGAAPVERAILQGENVTGVSIMKMDEGLDTGDIYATRQVDIKSDTNTKSLFVSLNSVAGDLLLAVLDNLETTKPTPQSGEPSYAGKLEPKDFFFDQDTSCVDVDRRVRAAALIKGAWTNVDGQAFRIIDGTLLNNSPAKSGLTVGTINRDGRLVCSDGIYQCKKIQVPNKAVMNFEDWVNGVSKDKFPLKINS